MGPSFRNALVAGLAMMLASAGCAGSLTDPALFVLEDLGDAALPPDSGLPDVPDGGQGDSASGSCPDVPTLLLTTCAIAGCHAATEPAQGLNLQSPDVASRLVGACAMGGGGMLIDPQTPDKSVLYTKLTASPPFGSRMPFGGALDDGTIACVLAWVSQASQEKGDAGNCPCGTVKARLARPAR